MILSSSYNSLSKSFLFKLNVFAYFFEVVIKKKITVFLSSYPLEHLFHEAQDRNLAQSDFLWIYSCNFLYYPFKNAVISSISGSLLL